MLRRDRRAANHEHIHPGLHHRLVVLLGVLRGERTRHNNPRITDLLKACGNQLRLNRLGVDLLHPPGR